MGIGDGIRAHGLNQCYVTIEKNFSLQVNRLEISQTGPSRPTRAVIFFLDHTIFSALTSLAAEVNLDRTPYA